MGKCDGHHHTNLCGLKCVLLCLLFHIHIHSCHDADIDATAPPNVTADLSLENQVKDETWDPAEDIMHKSPENNTHPKIDYLKILFDRYGNGEVLTFEGFEHLLEHVNFTSLHIQNHSLGSHFVNGTFQDLHQIYKLHSTDSHPGSTNQDITNRSSSTSTHSSNPPNRGRRRHQKQRRSPRNVLYQRQQLRNSRSIKKQCLNPVDILINYHITSPLNMDAFMMICPALIYQLDATNMCSSKVTSDKPQNIDHHDHDHDEHDDSHNETVTTVGYNYTVWGYAFVSVMIISLVGLLCVAVIPLTTKVFYNHLLQFLVALAVGSLTGDACLHLLPHALSPHGHSHSSHNEDESNHSEAAVWKGLVMLCGIYFFFLTERVMGLITERKRKKNKKQETSPQIYKPIKEKESHIGAKLSSHAKVTSCEEMLMVVHPSKDIKNLTEDAHDQVHENCDLGQEDNQQVQGYSSSHGHSHGPLPTSVSSVAWMVIMGDGLHNFSDGLAIGASFANSLSGGLSTTVAVFCHELPHELGDFAVLLRAGMSAKKAIVYNLVSSVLSLFGMVVGVAIGNLNEASLWIFAIIGGSFIYVALVDMLPELTAVDPKDGEHPLVHLILQNVGLLAGASIMLVIALYEDKIKIPHWET